MNTDPGVALGFYATGQISPAVDRADAGLGWLTPTDGYDGSVWPHLDGLSWLGHEWINTTMIYVHVHRSHVEDAWVQAGLRASGRLAGERP